MRPSTGHFSYQMPNGSRNSRMAAVSVISRFSSWMRMRAIWVLRIKSVGYRCAVAGQAGSLAHLEDSCRSQFTGKNQPAGDTFEQEFENLEVAAGLIQVPSP